jgi:hypothetical protein
VLFRAVFCSNFALGSLLISMFQSIGDSLWETVAFVHLKDSRAGWTVRGAFLNRIFEFFLFTFRRAGPPVQLRCCPVRIHSPQEF